MPSARRHRACDRYPGRQVSVLHEMMLGEPDEVEPEPVQPLHLVEDRAVEGRMGGARIQRVPKIVHDADAELGFRHQIAPPNDAGSRSPLFNIVSGTFPRSVPEHSSRPAEARSSRNTRNSHEKTPVMGNVGQPAAEASGNTMSSRACCGRSI